MSKSTEGAGILAYISPKSDVEVGDCSYAVAGLSLTALSTIVKDHLGVLKELVSEHKGGGTASIDYTSIVTTAPAMVSKLIATSLGYPEEHITVRDTWPAGLQVIIFAKVVEATAVDLDQLGKLVGSLLAMLNVEEITPPIELVKEEESEVLKEE